MVLSIYNKNANHCFFYVFNIFHVLSGTSKIDKEKKCRNHIKFGSYFFCKAYDQCIYRQILQFENFFYNYLVIIPYSGFWGMFPVMEQGWSSEVVVRGVKECSWDISFCTSSSVWQSPSLKSALSTRHIHIE